MDTFVKAAACTLIALVLCISLSKEAKDLGLLLAITVSCMVLAAAVNYLSPVVSFFERLQQTGKLNADLLRILYKAVGVGMLAEITAMICADAGNAALGKALKVLSGGVILWLALPLFEKLLELVEEILVLI